MARLGERYKCFDEVGELAEVTGPVVMTECLLCIVSKGEATSPGTGFLPERINKGGFVGAMA